MEVPNNIPPTQLIMITILLSILLVWMIVFTWLAIRTGVEKLTDSQKLRAIQISKTTAKYTQNPAPTVLQTSTANALLQTSHPASLMKPEVPREAVLEHSR